MDDAPKYKRPGQTTGQHCQTSYSTKPIGAATAVICEMNAPNTRETAGTTTQNEVDVTEFVPPPQTAGTLPVSSDNDQQALFPSNYLGEKSQDSIDSETSFRSTDPIIFGAKTTSFDRSEEFHSAVSANNSENADCDFNSDVSPVPLLRAHSTHEEIFSGPSTSKDTANRPFVKILQDSAFEFNRKLSKRFFSQGQASHRRRRHSLSFDSVKRHTYSCRRSSFLRHSWSGSKSRKRTLRKLSGYHKVKSASDISGGTGTQCASALASHGGRLANIAGSVEPAGTKLLVAVDVHRTLSGEPIAPPHKVQVPHPKRKTRSCGDDPLAIDNFGDDPMAAKTSRVHDRESLMNKNVRPPAAFKSNCEVICGEIDESQGSTDGSCPWWSKFIDRVTRPCPGCSKYLGPILVTVSVIIFLACVTAVIILFTWIFTHIGSWF